MVSFIKNSRNLLRMPARIQVLLSFGFVVSFQVFASLAAFGGPIWPLDEGLLLVDPELILKGKVPQLDFAQGYPPGNIWLLSLAFKGFGVHIDVERSVGLMYQLVLVVAIFFLVRRLGYSVAIVSCALSSLTMVLIRPIAFAWMGALCLFFASVAILTSPGRPVIRGAITGFLCALVILWRVDMGFGVFLCFPLCLFWMRFPRQGVIAFALAFLTGSVPFVVHGFRVGWPLLLNSILPNFQTRQSVAIVLGDAPPFVGKLYTLCLISIIATVVVGGWKWRTEKGGGWEQPRVGFQMLMCGLGLVGIVHQMLQCIDLIHVLFVCVAAIPFGVAATSLAFRTRLAPPIVAVLLLVFTPFQISVKSLKSYMNASFPTVHSTLSPDEDPATAPDSRRRYLPMNLPSSAEMFQQTIDRMREISKPGETLFIGPFDVHSTAGNDVALYHMLPWLSPASRIIELYPYPLLSESNFLGLNRDLVAADWVILNSSGRRSPTTINLPAGMPSPRSVIELRFDAVWSIPEVVVVYKNKDLEKRRLAR